MAPEELRPRGRRRERGVDVVMAGDTHDLEHYRETYGAGGGPRSMWNFVNGRGGAYLSIGTAMDPPDPPALPNWACYPHRDAIVTKLDRETRSGTSRCGGGPFAGMPGR